MAETIRLADNVPASLRCRQRDIDEAIDCGERLLTADDVAERLRCSPRAAYRLFATGQIVVVRVGHLVRCTPGDLDRFVREHRTGERMKDEG